MIRSQRICGLLLLAMVCPALAGQTEAPGLADFDRLWNYGQPAETEVKFRELLEEAAAGDDRDLHAQLLTQIARCQGLQRMFTESHGTLDEAAALIGDAEGTAGVRLLLERGRCFNSSGEKERSLPLFESALEDARSLDLEYHAVDAAHMLGIVTTGETSLAWNMKAIEMAAAARDPRAEGWQGSLLNNTGWTYHDMGEFEQALDLFERALVYRSEKGQAPQTRIAKWCVARCRRSLGDLEIALAMQNELEAAYRELAEEDGYVYEEIGELLLLMEGAAEAAPWFAKAHTQLAADPWLQANEAERLARLKELSESP
jgi:tetratricopeptide (TPR) repeat protein